MEEEICVDHNRKRVYFEYLMREHGQIIRIDEDGRGIVRLDVHGGCEHCGMSGSCQLSGTGKRELHLQLTGKGFHVGDLIEVETSSRSLIVSAFLVFILPLILAILVYGIVAQMTPKSGWAMLGFFAMFVLSELIVAWIDRKLGKKTFFEPRIVGKLPIDNRL
jgi:positive regulator of sigma E activity